MSGRTRLLMIHEAMGGVGRHVSDVVCGLDPHEFEIKVVFGTSRIDDAYREAMHRMREHADLIPCDALVRSIEPGKEVEAILELGHIIRDFHPDVVHCHSSKAGVVGRIAARRYGVERVFYTPHAYAFQSKEFSKTKQSLFTFAERLLSRHATTMTFNVSSGERDAALEHHVDKADKFTVIYNGIADIALPTKLEARQLLDLPQEAIVIGVTARLVEQKDPMTSLRIVERLVSHDPRIHMAYIGDGDLEPSMREYCRLHHLEDNVHFLGYRADAQTVVAAFDVYLLTSLYEGMPYSLVEALRAGVPLAVTAATGNAEVAQPGVNGALFPVGDVDAGVEAVRRLITDPLPAERVRNTFLSRFRVEDMVGTLRAWYLGRAAGGPGACAGSVNEKER